MNFPKYIQLLFLLSLTFFLQAQENNIKYVSPPAWIKTIDFSPEFKTDLDEINNGVLYLLVDEQFNFLEHESYYHFLKKFISNTGIHDHSEYSINYSPIYQEVIFHHLKIYRNDKVIDIRDKVEIKEVDDGNSSSTNIYLGDKAIVLIFKDLRTEDILDISYSINGRNPIYGDIVFKSFLFQFSDPVEKIYKACVVPSDLPLFTKEFNKAPAPIISIYGNAKRYEWEISKIEGIHWPDYVPVWYLPYKYVELSQFSNWNELAQWGLKLYPKLTDPNLLIKVKVAEVQEANSDKQTQALLLIKFVQEEIRYVGLEEGIHAITPHSPNEVISNRYGDCKDKTYLLQALMAQIGIDSKIAWVSTNNKHALENYLPSPSLFDHVILYFNLIGKDYYIDATQNNQADNLDRISFPDVKKALVLDNETYQLDIIPTNEEGKLNVKESIIVESATEPVFFDIKSVYSGRQADVMRDNYSYQGISAFKSNLINFYSSYYPDIVWEQDLTITDDKKLNQITLHEKYKISGFWQEYDDGVEKQNYSTELYAMTIRSYLISPDDKVREMPVSLNYPVEVHQHT
ncbi:MAG: DUF3857 domain-containing protein, partial [Bacteroidetes bacterium]|nr:DUF3857 domain-containing protein [Bacteroidota bacterium]